MEEKKEKSSIKKVYFWHSLPKLLTGIAAVLGAVTTLIVTLNNIPGNNKEAQVNITETRGKSNQREVGSSISGSWHAPSFTSDTTGIIQLNEKGGAVTGRYNLAENSKILNGTLDGKELNAFWVESKSNQKCDTMVDNRYYWGKVKIIFDPVFANLTGVWGYCDEEPSRGFTGVKVLLE